MSFPPQLFGRYYVYDKLAVGGMAEIFKAKLCGEHSFQKTIIIKRLLQSKQQRQYEHLFIDEAHLSASLMHPNIVQTYDFCFLSFSIFVHNSTFSIDFQQYVSRKRSVWTAG